MSFLPALKHVTTALVMALALASPAVARDLNETINVNGETREYLLHIPNNLGAGKRPPLVILLHGGGGGPNSIMRSSGMNALADREGFIAVYPAGVDSPGPFVKGTWNAGGCCGASMRNDEADVLFISRLIDKMLATQNVDAKRVYVGGMSNGAMLSHRVAATLSDKVAAAAIVSGAIFQSQPPARTPVSLLIFHGMQDTTVPYNGGYSPNKMVANNQSLPFKSAPQAFAYWSQQDGCSGPPLTQQGKSFTLQTASRCAGGNAVVMYSMPKGTHEWPRASSSTTAGVDATTLMWNFFKAHPKP